MQHLVKLFVGSEYVSRYRMICYEKSFWDYYEHINIFIKLCNTFLIVLLTSKLHLLECVGFTLIEMTYIIEKYFL